LLLFALYSFGKDKYFEKTTLFCFTYLIKGTALWWALWRC